ncbi:siderophore ABC transporter substrate-binding protein [Halomonas shantousis]
MKTTSLLAVVLLSLSGVAMANDTSPHDETDSERVVSFDYGSLDTLDALGLSEQIVGVPKQGLPDYLSKYADDTYTDVGGLKSPDLETLRQLSPTLVLITGRQNEQRETLQAVAPVMDTSLDNDDYLDAFDANVRQLAERFDAEKPAESALQALHEKIDEARQRLDNAPSVLTVTHNQGSLTLNRHPVAYEVLGLTLPKIPDSVPSETHGNRTFTRLSPQAIAEIAPDVLLIIDRSAAIGDDAADLDALRQSLADAGAEDVRIEMLSPELWYLSGGGLQSLSLQIDEVVNAVSGS